MFELVSIRCSRRSLLSRRRVKFVFSKLVVDLIWRVMLKVSWFPAVFNKVFTLIFELIKAICRRSVSKIDVGSDHVRVSIWIVNVRRRVDSTSNFMNIRF